jgi:hypothetical protein
MKQKLLIFLFWIVSIPACIAQSQYNIVFSYDGAGNQTQRSRVCINCSAKTQEVLDSIAVKPIEEIAESPIEELAQENNNTIIAYPNPVTDYLTVEWVNDTKSVSQITVFSGNNSRVLTKILKPSHNSIELGFSGYPPGMYIALVIYSDGSKQSFQILKK